MRLSVTLALLAAPCAACLLSIFRKTSNQAEIRATRNRMLAHLMEFRLYGEEPGVIWKSQKALLRENAHYLRLMLRPALLTAFPATLLLFAIDGWCGRTPLEPGTDSVLTIQMRAPLQADAIVPVPQMPPGILVGGPPVRIASLRQVSWRIHPSRKTSGMLRIPEAGGVITRRIEAGTSRTPIEFPVRGRGIEWVRIQYPPALVEMFGMELSPVAWFTVVWFLLTALFGLGLRVAS